MPSFRLLLSSGTQRRPVTLCGDRWVVGRDRSSDVQLCDQEVGRRHALLYVDRGALWIENISGGSKILVNDHAILDRSRLEPTDRIRIGDSLLEVDRPSAVHVRVVADWRGSPPEVESALARAHGDAELLDRVSEALTPTRRPEDAASLVLDLLSELLETDLGLVARITPRDSLRVLAAECYVEGSAATCEIPRPVIAQLRDQGALRVRGQFCFDPRAPDDAEVENLLALMSFGAGHVGMIHVRRKSSPGRSDELAILRAVARLLSYRIQLLDEIQHLREEHRSSPEQPGPLSRYIGVSDTVVRLREQAEELANSTAPLTILGERGTGKEALARFIHTLAGASGEPGPFVVLEAASLPRFSEVNDVLGIAEGGLLQQGRLVRAHGGSLCVRMVDALPFDLQDQLAFALENSKLTVGGRPERLNVRLFVTSTLPAEKLFTTRALTPPLRRLLGRDLLVVPPLRERIGDLPLLVANILERYARETSSRTKRLSPRAMDRLRLHDWPSNLSELHHVLVTAAVLAPGNTIYPKHIVLQVEPDTDDGIGELKSLASVEKDHIQRVLQAVGGNKVLAARTLGIASSTLYEKLKRYR